MANSFIICFGFIAGFLVAKTFVDLVDAVDESGAFWVYGGICLVGTVFTAVFVPETRGKSIDEIQAFYTKGGRRRSSAKDAEQGTPLNQMH